MNAYVLALDQGTTSSRAILFDEAGQAVATAQQETYQSFPRPGWVEQDANEIWATQLQCARDAIMRAAVSVEEIVAIGIANQRETTVVWNRRTGQPICPAIVWQDRRTAADCDQLKADGLEPLVQDKTGLVIDAYFSATKLRWILDHVPDARAAADRGEMAFGTVDSWLIWNLTGGRRHLTDVSNASRTMLLNLHSLQWDDGLLSRLNIPRSVLPELVPSSGDLAVCDAEWFGRPLPIMGVAGDQQAALFGQTCFTPGLAKNTYGTGCFGLINVGDRPRASQYKLLSTVAWQRAGRTDYALEGSVFVGGAVVQWLRDGLGIIRSADEIEALAASVPDSGGVYLVPAIAGLGAPYWDQYARGTIVGLTRGTTAAHLARAALEGIAFQVADMFDVMTREAAVPINQLRVDGGGAKNDLLLQFQADLLQRPVVRPSVVETTALGAAFLAGLAAGVWRSDSELEQTWRVDRVFEPAMSDDEVFRRRERWAKALQRSRDWDTDTK